MITQWGHTSHTQTSHSEFPELTCKSTNTECKHVLIKVLLQTLCHQVGNKICFFLSIYNINIQYLSNKSNSHFHRECISKLPRTARKSEDVCVSVHLSRRVHASVYICVYICTICVHMSVYVHWHYLEAESLLCNINFHNKPEGNIHVFKK